MTERTTKQTKARPLASSATMREWRRVITEGMRRDLREAPEAIDDQFVAALSRRIDLAAAVKQKLVRSRRLLRHLTENQRRLYLSYVDAEVLYHDDATDLYMAIAYQKGALWAARNLMFGFKPPPQIDDTARATGVQGTGRKP